MLNRHYVFVICLAIIGLMLAGCSSRASTPVEPLDSPINVVADASSRVLLGAWTMDFDAESMTASVMPERSLLTHYQAKYLIPTPLVVINTIYPNYVVDADVTLANPYPFDVYDVRLIIYTDDDGHMLENADDWTGLYDIPGGEEINPFKAYAKDVGYRKFAGETNHTENLLVYNPPGSCTVQFAVDASYPWLCKEPYSIEIFNQEDLYENINSQAYLGVEVYDWIEDVSSVVLLCPEITGEPEVYFDSLTPLQWRLDIVNRTGADSGYYTGYIAARSENSGTLALYDMVTITILAGNSPCHTFEGVKTGGDTSDDSAEAVSIDKSGNIFICGCYGRYAFLCKYDSGGNFIWEKSWRGDSFNNWGYSVGTDNSGSVYVSGSFSGMTDFGDGNPVQCNGSRDIFLTKHDANGNLKWVRTWGGTGEFDIGYSVAVNDSGAIYVSGSFEETVDFGDGNPIPSNGRRDAFLCKYNMNGDFEWVKTWGGDFDEIGYSVAIDNIGNVYVTGYFKYKTDFGDGNFIYSYMGTDDAFLCKHNAYGDFEWVKTWGRFQEDIGNSVAVDQFDNIYTTGGFLGNIRFGDGDPIESNGGFDAFLCKHDSNGGFEWVRTWGGYGMDQGLSVAVDNSGYVNVTGYFFKLVDFGNDNLHLSNGGPDSYLSKHNSEGDLMCIGTWGGAGYDHGRSVACDNQVSVFVAGSFEEAVDFGDGNPIYSIGERDVYLLKFSVE